jgi:putative SOS response-associated peptidase YedK
MCGRFTLAAPAETLARQFELPEVPVLEPHYNIAPTQAVAVVRLELDREERMLELMRWGLIPRWAKDESIGNKLINARAETVAEKPAFRDAFQKRRCLVVADGFYEWQVVPGQKRKQPYFFHLDGGGPFAFAGLWERWKDPAGNMLYTCTLITTEANDLVHSVHPRMPVILAPADYALWLDPSVAQPGRLQSLLRPYPPERMEAYPVGFQVNSPNSDTAECILPLAV